MVCVEMVSSRSSIFLLLAVMWTLGGCGVPAQTENAGYQQITAEEAKELMDVWKYEIILDVREQDEYDEGHIPGAILIPHEQITEKAEEILPDKDQQILVYCRSGRRSKIAAEALAKLGYTDIKEFGGIIDWSYEVEK